MEQLDPARSIYYRHFDLPARFPVVGLLGDLWRISDAPVTRMHFHNCMEIGLILDGSGEFFAGGAFAGMKIPGFPAMSGTGASAFGFIVFGCMMALFNFVIQKVNERKEKMKAASLPLSGGKAERLGEVQV